MDIASLIQCTNFAAIKHADQRRKDANKTPYINHPIGVAFILTDMGGVTDMNVLQAALLHDTVEDTDTTFEEIEAQFGKEVRRIVEAVTDDKSKEKQERKRLQIVNAAHSSADVKLVKLADKLYNLRDLLRGAPTGWTEERVQEYFEWSAKVVKGLRNTNKPIEDELDGIFRQRNVYDFSV